MVKLTEDCKARFKRHAIAVLSSINQLSSTFSATVARRLSPMSNQSWVEQQAESRATQLV